MLDHIMMLTLILLCVGATPSESPGRRRADHSPALAYGMSQPMSPFNAETNNGAVHIPDVAQVLFMNEVDDGLMSSILASRSEVPTILSPL